MFVRNTRIQRGGQGYWLEGAYRFSRSRDDSSWLGRLQAIGRVQQFYLGTPSPDDVLPGADTQQVDFGLNYYLPHDVRLNASGGRQFSSLGNANVWNLQITYRFLFPLHARGAPSELPISTEPFLVGSCRGGDHACCAKSSRTTEIWRSRQGRPQKKRANESAEGEKRFETHCGRCHVPPEALSPREVKAVLRHMRVRANLTEEDQRLILKYLAP